jgi:hypothetical protein
VLNANITVSDILNNFDLPWNAYWWSHPDVMPEHLISQNDFEHWNSVSKNPKVSMDYIFKNLHLPWNWSEVSKNPNLTIDIIVKYPDIKWDYDYGVSQNKMTYDPKLYNIKI